MRRILAWLRKVDRVATRVLVKKTDRFCSDVEAYLKVGVVVRDACWFCGGEGTNCCAVCDRDLCLRCAEFHGDFPGAGDSICDAPFVTRYQLTAGEPQAPLLSVGMTPK